MMAELLDDVFIAVHMMKAHPDIVLRHLIDHKKPMPKCRECYNEHERFVAEAEQKIKAEFVPSDVHSN